MDAQKPNAEQDLLARIEQLAAENLRLRRELEEAEIARENQWIYLAFLRVYGDDTFDGQPCPFCGKGRIRLEHEETGRHWRIVCPCGASGPNCPDAVAAVDAWNGALRPEPEEQTDWQEGMEP